MKRFLKKRWHHLPVGIITAVLLVCLLAGGAFAAYAVFMGNANVTVVEAITVTNTTGDGGEAFTGTAGNYAWNVSIYPGQTKILNVLVSNASPNALSIGATGTAAPAVIALGVTSGWSGAGSVAGNGSEVLTLTVTAAADASPGTYTIYFDIFRG